MRRLNPAPRADRISEPQSNEWLQAVTERLGVYRGTLDPVVSELPNNQWVLFKNTATNAVNFFYNDEGTLRNVALSTGTTGDVTGPAGAVNNHVVFFDGATGKLIKDSGLTLSGSNTGDQTITLSGDVTGTGTGAFATTVGKIGGKNITLAGNLTTVGAFASTFTMTGVTTVTFPVSGTLATVNGTTAAGGTVTQLVSKSAGVTLNAATGQITMNNAALAANTTVTFTLTNSSVAATDIVLPQLQSGHATPGSYQVWCEASAAGSVKFNVRNITAGSLSEALVISFAVVKSVTA